MPLSNLAESRIRNLATFGNLAPLPLAGVQRLDNCGVDGLVHDPNYPDPDRKVNPHMDTTLRQHFRMKSVREIVAENVKRRMIGDLDTQPKLAKKAGVGQAHISRIVNEKSGVTIDRLEMVARAFRCQPYELLLDGNEARRAIIEQIVLGPAVSTERVEQAGFVPMPNEDDGEPDPLEQERKPDRRYKEGTPPGRLKVAKTAGRKK